MMMIVSFVCVFIRTTHNNEIFAFNSFIHNHTNKTNTINTVYYVIKNYSVITHTLHDYRYVTLRLKPQIRHVTCDVTQSGSR